MASWPKLDPYISLMTGEQWYPAQPEPTLLTPQVLSLSLARLPRWCGQFRSDVQWYSVAQHSLLVADMMPDDCRLLGLLHDWPEAFTGFGDVPAPLKPQWLKDREHGLLDVLWKALGVDWWSLCLKALDDADKKALVIEAKTVMHPDCVWHDCVKEWWHIEPPKDFSPWPMNTARIMYQQELEKELARHAATTQDS